MENNTDRRLEALHDFIKQEKKVVTNELKEILRGIAKNGRFMYQWEFLKPLYAYELEQVMDNFLENFPPKNANGTDNDKVKELQDERDSILKIFSNFSSAPFTIQRISELIIQPRKHYKTCAKFFRGLSKNLLVVSTVDPEDSEASTIDPVDSDQDETPSKKVRLDNEEESRMRTANEQRPPVLHHNRLSKVENTALMNGNAVAVEQRSNAASEIRKEEEEGATQGHSLNQEAAEELDVKDFETDRTNEKGTDEKCNKSQDEEDDHHPSNDLDTKNEEQSSGKPEMQDDIANLETPL